MAQNRPTVAIIGAGPAGCSCAIVLLQSGSCNVKLISAPQKDRFQIGESIPPDMNPLLRELDVYTDFIKQEHAACYGSCSYWGSDLRGYNDTILSPHGHGWHLDRQKFNSLLFRAAQTQGAEVISESVYRRSYASDGRQVLELKHKTTGSMQVDADFVVDATGTRSVYAKSQGCVQVEDTALICLGLRFGGKMAASLATLTHLESAEHGWWYGARLPGNQVLVTLYTNAATVKHLGLQSLRNWISLLQSSAQTRDWIRHLEPVDQRLLAFPAASFCLDRIYGEHFLALGDAASSYDPITANGIIKAITHGMRGGRSIVAHLRGAQDALPLFDEEVRGQHEQYRAMRHQFYAMEQRWPASLFWEEMHSMA